jgi:hypothetical protein
VKLYQETYRCSNCEKECQLTVNIGKEELPPVCPWGKNVANVIEGDSPSWEVRGQRYRPETVHT